MFDMAYTVVNSPPQQVHLCADKQECIGNKAPLPRLYIYKNISSTLASRQGRARQPPGTSAGGATTGKTDKEILNALMKQDSGKNKHGLESLNANSSQDFTRRRPPRLFLVVYVEQIRHHRFNPQNSTTTPYRPRSKILLLLYCTTINTVNTAAITTHPEDPARMGPIR